MKLFIDTTQNYCNLALVNDMNQLVDTYQELADNNMTDIVVEKIQLLLKKNNVKKSEIKAVYLLIGPGSFTGCRVGFIIAMTWASVYKVELYIMNSLLFQTNKGTGISIIDAKSNKKFVAIYEKYDAKFSPAIVLNSEVENIINKYNNFKKYEDYKNVNFFKRLIQHIEHFELTKNPETVEPLYLKEPIQKYEN